jgi:hypothetical protein
MPSMNSLVNIMNLPISLLVTVFFLLWSLSVIRKVNRRRMYYYKITASFRNKLRYS